MNAAALLLATSLTHMRQGATKQAVTERLYWLQKLIHQTIHGQDPVSSLSRKISLETIRSMLGAKLCCLYTVLNDERSLKMVACDAEDGDVAPKTHTEVVIWGQGLVGHCAATCSIVCQDITHLTLQRKDSLKSATDEAKSDAGTDKADAGKFVQAAYFLLSSIQECMKSPSSADSNADSLYSLTTDTPEGYSAPRTVGCVPIITQDKCIGVL